MRYIFAPQGKNNGLKNKGWFLPGQEHWVLGILKGRDLTRVETKELLRDMT